MYIKAVTVLITTYNCAPYIKQAIKSILNQTYKNFELLIIDDGSTDDTKNVVYSIDDKRIIYKVMEHSGRSQALNLGLSIAKYCWISIMDADDVAHPLRLEKQIIKLTGNENQICFTDAAFFKKSKILYTIRNNFYSKNIDEKLALHGHFINSTFLFNKNHILKFGGYDNSLIVFEDYDLWLRIWEKSEIIFVNDILQFVRLRKNSLSKSNTNYIKKIFYNIQEKYFLDLVEKCNTSEEFTIPKIQGWREYFYGDKNLVRVNWLKVNMNDWDYRMFLAFIISFFPERFLNFFKNLRLRLRFEYILNRNGKYRGIDEKFRKLLLEDEK